MRKPTYFRLGKEQSPFHRLKMEILEREMRAWQQQISLERLSLTSFWITMTQAKAHLNSSIGGMLLAGPGVFLTFSTL